MVFRTIDDETSISGKRIKAGFSSSKQGIDFSEINRSLNSDIDKLENYLNSVSGGKRIKSARKNMMGGSSYLQDYVTSNNYNQLTKADMGNINIGDVSSDFTRYSTMKGISTISADTSLSNVSRIINTYNNSLKDCGLTQSDFSDAVLESNKDLGNYLKKCEGGKATMMGYRASLVKTKIATIGMQMATMALNMVMSMAVMGVINLAIKGFQSLANKAEDAKDKLSELNDEISSNENELKSLSDELKNINDQIDELISKGTLSFSDKNELDTLKAERIELERKVALLEREQEIAKNERKTKFAEAFDADINKTWKSGVGFSEQLKNLLSGTSEKEYVDYMLKKYSLKGNTEAQKEASEYLNNKVKELNELREGLDYVENPTAGSIDEKNNERLAYIDDLIDKWSILSNLSNAKTATFDRLTNFNFKDETESLKSLGEQGKVTAENLDKLYNDKKDEGIVAFIDKLKELGVIADTSKDSLELIALAFNNPGVSIDEKVSPEVASKLNTLTEGQLDIVNDLDNKALAAGLEVPDDVYSSWEKLKGLIDSISAKNIEDSFATAVSKVEGLSFGLDQLAEIYHDVKDGGDFDYGKMLNNEDFTKSFGDLGSVYDEFIKTISNSPKNIGACQNAFNKLTGAYINQKTALNNITDETKSVIALQLKQMGISNADEIVEQRLAAAKLLGGDASWQKAAALYAEAEAGSEAQRLLGGLLSAEIDLNNVQINTASDVEQLINLANAAGASAEFVARLQDLLALMSGAESLYSNTDKDTGDDRKGGNTPHKVYKSQLESLKASITAALTDGALKKLNAEDFITPTYNPKNPEKKSEKKEDAPVDRFNKYVSKLFDWIEVRLGRLQSKTEKYFDKAENLIEDGEYKAAKTNYKKAANNTSKEIKANQSAVTRYQTQADDILSKAVSEGVISKKRANSIKKNVKDGTIDISKYNEDTQTVIKEYQNYYEKGLEASKKLDELVEQYSDYVEKTYGIPSVKADDIIEKLEDEASDLEDEINILDYAREKNAKLDEFTSNSKNQLDTYKTEKKEATTNLDNAWKNSKNTGIADAKKTKANKGKKKGEKLSTDGLEVNSEAYKAVIKYNAALDAQQKAVEKVEDATVKYSKTLRENAKAKFDNISDKYDSKQSVHETNISHTKTKIDSLDTFGKSQTGKEIINLYNSEISSNEKLLAQKKKELSDLEASYAENQADMSDDDRRAAQNAITTVKEEILNVEMSIEDLNTAIENIELTKLDIALSRLKTTASNLQHEMDIKETKGYDLTSADYDKQIDNSKQQVKNLEDQNKELKRQQQGLETNSKKYQDLQTRIDSNNDAIQSAEKSQLEWNIAIKNLPLSELEKHLQLLEAISGNISSEISLKEAKSLDLTLSDYLTQIESNNNRLENARKSEQEIYSNYLAALADGAYAGKSADEWLIELNNTRTEINNIQVETEKIKDTLRDDVYWRTFERAHEAIKRLSNTLSGISDLISEDMLFDSDGSMTEFGLSKLSILVKSIENSRSDVHNYLKDIENLNKLYSQGMYTQEEYTEKFTELQTGLLDAAGSVKSYTDSVINMYKDMASAELDALFELIDARNEALDAKKAYYEYDKTIRDKTKDIQALQAQIAALEGIDNAEAKAKRALLKADLAEAQEDLNDTITEHKLELSQDSLSEMKNILQEAFDDKFEDLASDLSTIQGILTEAKNIVSADIGAVNDSIEKLLKYYGIKPESLTQKYTESDFKTPAQQVSLIMSNLLSSTLGAIGVNIGFASGTKYVPRKMTAWTQEKGAEIIVTKHGMITPLDRGDGVIPAELTRRLYDMALGNYNILPDISPSHIGLPDISTSFSPSVSQHYDSLINIEGSADAVTVSDLKKLSADIIKKSHDYTAKRLYEDYVRSGGKRKI